MARAHVFMLFVALALALSLAQGCVAGATFRPRLGAPSAPQPQIVGEVLRVDETDIPALEKAGGTVLGTVSAKGNAYASDEALGEKAVRLAAQKGGTHVAETKPRGVGRNGTPDDAETRSAEFVVVRVPLDRWNDLPPSLRPRGATATAPTPTSAAPTATTSATPTPARAAPPPTKPRAACAARSGKYVIRYEERVGTCGAMQERVDVVGAQPTKIAAPCSGTIGYSDDNCTVTVQKTCPEPGTGAQVETHAEMVWSDDGARAKGSITRRVITEGDVRCESIYEVRELRP